ncbi:MAG: alpha/beta hydrolase [Rhodospirillales bacterium]
MALDRQVAALLDMAAKAGRPLLHTLSPDAARKQSAETRGPLQPPPPKMARVDNLTAPGPSGSKGAGPIKLRHYRPLGHPDNELIPVLVFFHGGGWVIGDLDSHDVLCRQLAEAAGCAVVAVDYRMAPEHKHPAAVEDAYAATEWVARNGAKLGIDGHRMALGGDSAGGNLAAIVCLMIRDALKADHEVARPSLQLLIYPATDMTLSHKSINDFADGYFLTRDGMRWFINHYLGNAGDARDWQASPLFAASHEDLPPAYIITAGFDPLRDEGIAYAQKLRAAGVMVDHIDYGGMIHAFIGMSGVIATTNRAIAAAGAALRQAFEPDDLR